MTFFITDARVGELDWACAEECPVDCIYVGRERAYINPAACIDCGNCPQVCPVDAIGRDLTLDSTTQQNLDDNVAFSTEILAGRTEPLDNPRGSLKAGVVGVDISRIEDAS